MKARPVVSVAGGAICTLSEATMAEAVGRGLASAGAILVCGGGAGGMEARRPRGRPPGGGARSVVVVRAGRALVAIGGGYGTLSEIAVGLKLGRRVIGLSTWNAANSQGEPAGILKARSPEEAVELALEGRPA